MNIGLLVYWIISELIVFTRWVKGVLKRYQFIQLRPLLIYIGKYRITKDDGSDPLFSERYGYTKVVRFCGLKIDWNTADG